MGTPITKEIADCIYTGCSTDTGCFKYSNVTPRTHIIASELIEAGADHSRINVRMFETKSMGDFMLQKMCLDSLEIFAEGKAAMITVTKAMLSECGVDKSALDAIKPVTRQIEGVEIGITVKEEDNGKVGISIRTGENADASAICAHFGGGGHVRAAGCEMKGTVEEAKEKIKKYKETQRIHKESLIKEIKTFVNPKNFPIYIHCSLGRDRTGTLCFLINALLGVSEMDLYRDYELSMMSKKGKTDGQTAQSIVGGAFTTLYNFIKNYNNADTLSDGARMYMIDLGITEEEIEAIKANMLERV